MHLPVIDFQNQGAPEAFCRSLHSTGFAVLTKHPLQPDLVAGIYAEWLDFFQGQAKHAYAHDAIRHDGYFSTAVSETAKTSSSSSSESFSAPREEWERNMSISL